MKRFIIAFAAFLAAIGSISAQGIPSNKYNRKGISVIGVRRTNRTLGTQDAFLVKHMSNVNMSEKYDVNLIPTKDLFIEKPRAESVTDGNKGNLTSDEILSALQKKDVGRQVMGYLFCRDKDGIMNDRLLRSRGLLNANDQDFMNSKATKIGLELIADSGFDLVSNNYIFVLDVPKVKDIGTSANFTMSGYVFNIEMDKDQLRDFLEKTWIYSDDTQSEKEAKRKAFEAYSFPIKFIGSATEFKHCDDINRTEIQNVAESIIKQIENSMDDWQSTAAITRTSPLRAKIGTKDNVHHSDLFKVYSFSEYTEGDLKANTVGYMRCIKVADNSGVAAVETPESEFYQVSGFGNIQPGMLIKQVHDARISVGLSAYVPFKGPAGIRLDGDWMQKILSSGIEHHFLLTIIQDFQLFSNKIGGTQFGVGYGLSINLFHYFSLMPYAEAGGMTINSLSNIAEIDSKDDIVKATRLLLEPGVRLTFSAMYPLQPYMGVAYKAFFDINDIDTETFKEINSTLYTPYKSGPAAYLGVKFNF